MTFTVCQSGEREVLGVPYLISVIAVAAALLAFARLGGLKAPPEAGQQGKAAYKSSNTGRPAGVLSTGGPPAV